MRPFGSRVLAHGAAALAQPRVRRGVLGDAQQRFADLRKNVDVLVAVDVVGRAAEGAAEGRELAGNLGVEQGRGERARKPAARHGGKRRKRAVVQRREAVGVRPERGGQRQVQADGRVISCGLAQRRRLGVRKSWRRHHHGSGVNASFCDQVADRAAHRG